MELFFGTKSPIQYLLLILTNTRTDEFGACTGINAVINTIWGGYD